MPRVRIGVGLGRGGADSGGPPPPTLFEQVLALAAGRPVFTAGNPANVVIAGKLVSMVDWNDPAHFMTQPNAALQALAPAVDVAFNGKPVLTATGGQNYRSVGKPADYFQYTKDGVSFESFRVYAPASTLLELLDGTATTFGPGGYQAYTGFTTLGAVGYVQTANYGPLIAEAPIYRSARLEAAGSPQYELRTRNVVEASGAYTGPGSAGASEVPLTLWTNSYPGFSFPFNGRWAAVLHFPALTPSQRAIVHAWILQEYGIAPSLFEQVLLLAQGRPIFTADHTIDSPGNLVSWIDHNDPAHFMTQSAGPLQVPAPSPSGAFGGAEVAAFDGAPRVYASTRPPAAWSFASDGISCEWFAAFRPNVLGLQAIMATLYNGALSTAPGFQLYWDLANYNATVGLGASVYPIPSASFGFAGSSPVYVSLRTEVAAVPQWEARRLASVIASGAYAVPFVGTPAGETLVLGALSPAGNLAMSGDLAALMFFPALTPPQRAIVHAWLLQTYAIPTL